MKISSSLYFYQQKKKGQYIQLGLLIKVDPNADCLSWDSFKALMANSFAYSEVFF